MPNHSFLNPKQIAAMKWNISFVQHVFFLCQSQEAFSFFYEKKTRKCIGISFPFNIKHTRLHFSTHKMIKAISTAQAFSAVNRPTNHRT